MSPPLVEWRDLPWVSLWKDKCQRVAQAVGITDHLKPGRVESGCWLITGVVCLSAPRDLGASGGKWDVAVALWVVGRESCWPVGAGCPPIAHCLDNTAQDSGTLFRQLCPLHPSVPRSTPFLLRCRLPWRTSCP